MPNSTPFSRLSPPLNLQDVDTPPKDFLASYALGGDFYRAADGQALPGFRLGYLIAWRDGLREAVVPYFVTHFKLNTMLEDGWLKGLMGGLGLSIACVGHPSASLGCIEGTVSPELLEQVFAHLKTKAPVVAMKGFGPDLPATGFVRVPGLPTAVLALQPNFWETRASHRRNFRRKRQAAAALRFEQVEGLPAPLTAQIHQLYLNTHSKAAVRFECLSRTYFEATAPLSRYVLAYLGDKLVGFAQLILKGNSMNALYSGLDYSVERQHGVYFALVMHAVDSAIASGCQEIELGETSYAFKRNLGSHLVDTWVYYRHRNPLATAVLARCGFLLAPSEKELE